MTSTPHRTTRHATHHTTHHTVHAGRGRSSIQAVTGRIAAVFGAVAVCGFLVMSVSRAAFTASTGNDNNSVSAGDEIVVSDDDAGVALFSATGVTPTTEIEKCVRVDYSGDFSSGDLMLYATPVSPAVDLGVLATYLNIDVDRIDTSAVPYAALPGDATHDCTAFNAVDVVTPADNIYSGTLAAFPSAHSDNLSAMPGVDGTYSFRFTISVVDDPAAAGESAEWNFVWETQSA